MTRLLSLLFTAESLGVTSWCREALCVFIAKSGSLIIYFYFLVLRMGMSLHAMMWRGDHSLGQSIARGSVAELESFHYQNQFASRFEVNYITLNICQWSISYNNNIGHFEWLGGAILITEKFNGEVVMFIKIIIMKCHVRKRKFVGRWELGDTILKDF